MTRALRTSLVALAVALAAPAADAAGLYYSDRGVRPMGRAGAWVAGADDLGAIWYNVAGIADAGRSGLLDFGWLQFSASYAREIRVLDADNTWRTVPDAAVSGSSPFLPIPTVAGSWAFGSKRQYTVAFGLVAPYIALAGFPDTVNGRPSPARYALGSYEGSVLAIPGVYFAWKPHETLRVGAGLLALVGKFQTTVTFSVSPEDRLIGAPEQPEYDATAQISVGPIFAPSATLGAIWSPVKWLRLGMSGHLPTVISSDATIKVRLPSSAVFDDAKLEGSQAHVRSLLAGVLRAGVEVRPIDPLRVEIAWVHEFWGAHESLDATPNKIIINGVPGLPPIPIPPIKFPQKFRDSDSVRLGGELSFKVGARPPEGRADERAQIDVRAGISYESSAVPPAYLSLFTLDFDKVTPSLGLGIHLGKHWRFDAVYTHTFTGSVHVDPKDAAIGRVSPIHGNAPLEPINGGTYSADANLFGVGAVYTLD